jgi:hypothetical protein
VLLLVWDAGALDACGEATEEMADAMSIKEFGVHVKMRETIASENGGSPNSCKQLKKRKMLLMAGQRTPDALNPQAPAGAR